eukprot:TRINITY_DN8585_c0_g1_i1.p1 TRINITY_DN8585_c0_g1~~TRINITY_DN8585_c0_g1_i1.p1  ORF type:complete len:220 (-),score=45.60 TRINITY_DN8585_c0_g1_i1:91-750(-)
MASIDWNWIKKPKSILMLGLGVVSFALIIATLHDTVYWSAFKQTVNGNTAIAGLGLSNLISTVTINGATSTTSQPYVTIDANAGNTGIKCSPVASAALALTIIALIVLVFFLVAYVFVNAFPDHNTSTVAWKNPSTQHWVLQGLLLFGMALHIIALVEFSVAPTCVPKLLALIVNNGGTQVAGASQVLIPFIVLMRVAMMIVLFREHKEGGDGTAQARV